MKKNMETQENPVMFEAYVANLGKYNEDYLVGEWVEFPTTTEHMQGVFERIGIDGREYEEYFITDYEIPNFSDKLYSMLGEYESLNELNYLAQRMDESAIEPEMLNALLEMETPTSVADVINTIENEDCYVLLSDVHTKEDLGCYYIEEAGIYDLSAMGNLANYIDYEAFGCDIAMDITGGFTPIGFIEEVDKPTEHYSGLEDIPSDAKVMNFPKEKTKEKDEKSSLRENIQFIKDNQPNTTDKDKSTIKRDSHER